MDKKTIDILVIGSGIAGLLATQLLAEKGQSVMIVTDTSLLGGGAASYFPLKATLGIQTTALSPHGKEQFQEDFLRVSGNLIDLEKMNIYINESNGRETLLENIGLTSTLRQDSRPACFAKYSRPIHLISDWKKSQSFVNQSFQENSNITILYNTKAIKLFKNDNVITGALLFSEKNYTLVQAKIVILATGGIAGLYKDNLYPSSIDGSGWVLAHDIGAELINTEFVQFIPSFLKPTYKTLFGEHTIKYLKGVYDSDGNDIFSDLTLEEKKELFSERSGYAPFSIDFKSSLFDIRIFEANQKEGVVFEYDKKLYEDKEAFYTIYLDWLTNQQHINLLTDEIKIAHFAHASNGGIKISINGETTVQNLYALGEVSCGVEGANRMGGNSVGGIIVFTPRAVEEIISKINEIPFQEIQYELEIYRSPISLSSKDVRVALGKILQQYASIIRTPQGLKKALAEIEQLQQNYSITPLNQTINGFSALLAIQAGKILIQNMMKRKESIGAHYIKQGK